MKTTSKNSSKIKIASRSKTYSRTTASVKSCNPCRSVMQTSGRKYPAYKDSGVEWLGEIPEKWEVRRLKFILSSPLKYGANESGNEYDPTLPRYIRITDFTEGGKLNENKKLSLSWEKGRDYLLKDGDILFARSGATVGKSYQFKKKLSNDQYNVFAGYLIKASPDESIINSDYLSYFTATGCFDNWKRIIFNKATIENIGADKYSQLILTLPPLSEQTAIASFLDSKVAKIDTAIAQKEKLISLLKERKQIIIQNAVTKGLNPDVKMKDSGVEWIGEIPEHWEVKRFCYLYKQSRLPTRKNDEVVTSYRDGQVTLRSNRRLTGYTEAILEQGYQGIRKGQLVLNSMDAFEGAIGVSDSNGKCSPEYVICDKIDENVSNEYFAYLLREMALARYIQVICNAVRQRAVRIRYNNLKRQCFIVPPYSEQVKIVHHIQTQSARIDHAISLQQKQIDKLKEYKATLIDSAVTGKIKVF